jgi:hypothetical protein
MGNCPHRGLLPHDLYNAESDEEIIDFYMSLIRTYCNTKQKKYIQQLVNRGYLEVRNKLIVVPEDCKYLTIPKLTQKETEQLSAAFELSVFTLTYADQLKRGSVLDPVREEDGSRITRSTKFLIDMSLLSLKLSRDLCPLHAIRLSRNLVTTLITSITKLKQDFVALSFCDECVQDKEITQNDSRQLMTMIRFIIHEYANENNPRELRPAFNAFAAAHKEFIRNMVTKILKISDD